MKTQDKFLIVFFFILLTPILAYTQPNNNNIRDEIVCPTYFYHEKEKSGNYEQRKIESEYIIKEAPNVLQGMVLRQRVKIIKNTLYMEILLKLEHSFRGTVGRDTIVSIYRKIRTDEPYKLINGTLEQQSSSYHSYDWGIEKGLRYIFFCKEKLPYKDHIGFELYKESKVSYLSELQSKGWCGLLCMVYLDYGKLMNHLKKFDPIFIPPDLEFYYKDDSRGLKNMTPMEIYDFYPKKIRAGTGERLTITGSGFGSSGKVYFASADKFYYFLNDLDDNYVTWSDEMITIEIPSRAYDNGTPNSYTPASGIFKVVRTDGEKVYSYEILDNEEAYFDPVLQQRAILNIEYAIASNKENVGDQTENFQPYNIVKTHCNGIRFNLDQGIINTHPIVIPILEQSLNAWEEVVGFDFDLLKNNEGEFIPFDPFLGINSNIIRSNSIGMGLYELAITHRDDKFIETSETGGKKLVLYKNSIDINTNQETFSNNNYTLNDPLQTEEEVAFYETMLHELGHTLGLSHDYLVKTYREDPAFEILYTVAEDNLMNYAVDNHSIQSRFDLDSELSQRAKNGVKWVLNNSSDLILSEEQTNILGITNILNEFQFSNKPLQIITTSQFDAEINIPEEGQAPFSYEIFFSSFNTPPVISLREDSHTISFSMNSETNQSGQYFIRIIDANHCVNEGQFVLTGCNISVSFDVDCPSLGEANGTIIPIIENATEPYMLEWSYGNNNNSTEETLTNTSTGIHIFSLTDANGCSVEESFIVGPKPQVNSTVTSSCQPSSGAIELNIQNPVDPINIQWSNTTQVSNPITNLESGNYFATITDGNNCETIESFYVASGGLLSATVVTSPSCSDFASGEADVHPNGDYPPFTFEWSNGATSANVIDLAEGTHTVTITDSKNCSIIETVEIGVNQPIFILNPSVVTDCSGEGQASISPIIASGTAPFTYLWSDGQTTATASNLTSGNYTLTITDDFGCSQSFDFMLTVGERPMVTTTITAAHCKNNDGSVLFDIQPAGNYTIKWSDGLTTNQPFRDHLTAGNYVVVIGNAQGCFTTEYFTINSVETSSELWDGVEVGLVTGASTQTDCNGSIEVLLGGSIGPYSIYLQTSTGAAINNYENVADAVLFEDLCITAENAPYKIVIKDANGCSITKNVAIELCSLTITVEEFIRPQTTFDTDGSITVNIAENYTDVEYRWSTGEIGSTISGLSPGTYTVTAREKNGCEGSRTFVFDECYTLREILDEEGEVLDEVKVPNYVDFEVIISGGLFLPGQGETPIVAFLREEGATSFTAEFPAEYSITWRAVNQSIIGENINPIIIPSNYGSGFSPRWIELTVSNGCISKTIRQAIFDCGTENNEEAVAFFVVDEVQPCIGSNNGEISLAIPNLFNSSIEILYGTDQVPIEIQSDGIVGMIAIVSGLSVGDHQFVITIDGCENTFVYSLEEAPVDEERLNYDPITHTCIYQQFCEGNLLAQRTQEPWLDPMNGTRVPCLVPLMCGSEKVWDKPYDKRICRGIEYTSLLSAMVANGGFTPPFTNAYLNSQGNVSDCKWVKYCTGNMKQIGRWGIGGQAHFNGLTNSGCSKWKCTGFLIPNIRSCPDDNCNQFPPYVLDPDDAPTQNACTRYESFNLYGLITAYRNGWLDQAEGFSVSSLKNVLEELSALPNEELGEAKCAIAIFCADNYEFYYHNMDDISCEAVLIPITNEAPTTWIEGVPISIPDHEVEAITTCRIISTTLDPDTGYPLQEVIRCGKPDCAQVSGGLSFLSDCTTTQVINYQELFDIFGVQPFAAPPIQGLSRFDDPFLIERIVRLNTLKFQDFAIPKLVLATPQGRAFYDYVPGEGVQAKRSVEGLAYQIEDWDTGQSLIALTNQIGGYRLIYEDSLHSWDQLIYSPQDTNFSIKNISITENTDEVVISGLVNGDLYVRQLLVTTFDSPSFFTLKLSLDGDVLEFVAARNIGKDDVRESSFSKEGDFIFIGEASMERGTVQIGNDLIHPSADGKDQLIAFYNSTNGSFNLKTKIRFSENAKILKSAVGKNGEFGLLINNSDSLSFSNQHTSLHKFTGKSVLTSFSNAGQLQWQKTIEGNDFLASDLLYLPDSTIFLALTFQNEINIGNDFFQSAGGSDIALIQFSKEGEIILSQTYGTIENETVEKLFFNGKLMFFAGEFSGNIQEREIGEQHFIDYTPYNNEVYISYINLEKYQNEIINLKNKFALPTSPHFLKAYPNPFKNTFNLELNASSEDHITIEVVDLLGRLVFQQEGQVAKGFNQFEVKMKDVSSAQMLNVLVRFKSGKQQTMQTRLIRE